VSLITGISRWALRTPSHHAYGSAPQPVYRSAADLETNVAPVEEGAMPRHRRISGLADVVTRTTSTVPAETLRRYQEGYGKRVRMSNEGLADGGRARVVDWHARPSVDANEQDRSTLGQNLLTFGLGKPTYSFKSDVPLPRERPRPEANDPETVGSGRARRIQKPVALNHGGSRKRRGNRSGRWIKGHHSDLRCGGAAN
jgi:hypothetical protein